MILRLTILLSSAVVLISGLPASYSDEILKPQAPNTNSDSLPIKKEQMEPPQVSDERAGSTATPAVDNGWAITQINRVYDSPHSAHWSYTYWYISSQGLRIQSSEPPGTLTIARAPNWDLFDYDERTKTYAQLGNAKQESKSDETYYYCAPGDAEKTFTRVKVKGENKPIAGLKTNRYQKLDNFEGKPIFEWITADPQALPADLKEFATHLMAAGLSYGGHELLLRENDVTLGPRWHEIARIDAELASKPNMSKFNQKVLQGNRERCLGSENPCFLPSEEGRRTLVSETHLYKRKIPITTFDPPQGYRQLPKLEYLSQRMPAWIVELDRGMPKKQRLLPH